MTCIAALVDLDGTVWMGGDSAAVGPSDELVVRGDPKVTMNGPFLIGYCGSFRYGQILHHRFAPPPLPDLSKTDDLFSFMATDFVDAVEHTLSNREGDFSDSICMVGVQGRVYVIDDDLNVGFNVCGYDAIGSGSGVALGALAATSTIDGMSDPYRRLMVALTAAEDFTSSVRGPFTIANNVMAKKPLRGRR